MAISAAERKFTPQPGEKQRTAEELAAIQSRLEELKPEPKAHEIKDHPYLKLVKSQEDSRITGIKSLLSDFEKVVSKDSPNQTEINIVKSTLDAVIDLTSSTVKNLESASDKKEFLKTVSDKLESLEKKYLMNGQQTKISMQISEVKNMFRSML